MTAGEPAPDEAVAASGVGSEAGAGAVSGVRELRDEELLGAVLDHVDLSGSSWNRVDLTGSTMTSIDLSRVDLRNVALEKVRVRGAYLSGVEIWGEVEGLTVNGIDVGPLVEAELDRLHPERAALHPTDPDGYRAAWETLDGLWTGTVERARRLAETDPEVVHESVEGEWSFVQTLRHLPFATSSWLSRAIQGDPSPWHPLELPWDEMRPTPGVPQDRDARPALDEALELRRDRFERVRTFLAGLTDEELDATTDPVDGVGWPPAGESFPVKECLDTLLNEEWWHRQFAERDLAVLESRIRAEATGAEATGAEHASSAEATGAEYATGAEDASSAEATDAEDASSAEATGAEDASSALATGAASGAQDTGPGPTLSVGRPTDRPSGDEEVS